MPKRRKDPYSIPRITIRKPGEFSHFVGQPNPKNSVGVCTHNKHRGYLSVKAMKEHQCLGKRCPYFKKNEEHPYWIQHERMKQIRKARRQKYYGTGE